jgi:hypothetical protein
MSRRLEWPCSVWLPTTCCTHVILNPGTGRQNNANSFAPVRELRVSIKNTPHLGIYCSLTIVSSLISSIALVQNVNIPQLFAEVHWAAFVGEILREELRMWYPTSRLCRRDGYCAALEQAVPLVFKRNCSAAGCNPDHNKYGLS